MSAPDAQEPPPDPAPPPSGPEKGAEGPDKLVPLPGDFDLSAFLSSRGLSAAPESAFAHVEAAADSGIRRDMIVEMPTSPDGRRFWLARVLGVHGPLLRLAYLGDAAREVWHDLSRSRLFPLGWCQMNRIELDPPDAVRAACPDWERLALQTLEDVSYETISMHHIEGQGVTPADRIKFGMMLEVRSRIDPAGFWPAKVVKTKGGLIKLRYCYPKGRGKMPEDEEPFPMILFFTSDRLVPVGHALGEGRRYLPPLGFPEDISGDDGEAIARRASSKVPADVLCHAASAVQGHKVNLGEFAFAFEPLHYEVSLTEVTKIFDENFFELTDIEKQWTVLCHGASGHFFDFKWYPSFAEACGAKIRIPGPRTPGPDAKSVAPPTVGPQPDGFKVGQVLEIFYNGSLRLATIAGAHEKVLALRLDCDKEAKPLLVPSNFNMIFPLMWGSMNDVDCLVPNSYLSEAQGKAIKEEDTSRHEQSDGDKKKTENDQDGHWCPPIYFNYQCYSASFLSKARLAGLPKSIGPGSAYLVMKKVLELLIGASYKSASVLKRLECEEGSVRRDFILECLKGKSRVHNLKANIEVPSRSSQVEDYCKEVCRKLGACPYLISTSLYADGDCPARCQLRGKVADTLDDRGRGGRRVAKKRRHHFQSLNAESSVVGEGKEEDKDDDGDESSSTDESEEAANNTEPPSAVVSRSGSPDHQDGRKEEASKVRTRGAKFPDYRLHFKARPTKEEMKVIENNNFRENSEATSAKKSRQDDQQNPQGLVRVGSSFALEPAFKMSDVEAMLAEASAARRVPRSASVSNLDPAEAATPALKIPIKRIRVSKKPELWTPEDTAKFLAQTGDCAHLAHFMMEDEVDGVAFMLLTYQTAKEYWSLTEASAVRLCRHVESVKLSFFQDNPRPTNAA